MQLTEPLIIGILGSGGILWAIGGTGFKWARRFLLPVLYATVVFASGGSLLTCIWIGAATVAVNVLPYGDRTPPLIRWLVILLHNAPCLAINLMAWPVVLVASALSIGLFQATRKFNFITHKIWEFGAGFLQASCIVVSILMRQL